MFLQERHRAMQSAVGKDLNKIIFTLEAHLVDLILQRIPPFAELLENFLLKGVLRKTFIH